MHMHMPKVKINSKATLLPGNQEATKKGYKERDTHTQKKRERTTGISYNLWSGFNYLLLFWVHFRNGKPSLNRKNKHVQDFVKN